ncbi:MAG: creatininase family protein [Pyrodictiaceae archaeon]
MSAKRVFLEENRVEGLKEAIVVLPIASIEYHGVLPVGSDLLISRCVMTEFARFIRDDEDNVLIAPIIPYSVAVEHEEAGPTITVMPDTFARYLYEVLVSLHSFARGVVVTVFHGGVYPVAYATARWAMRSTGKRIITDSFWEHASKIVEDEVPGYNILHADFVEASILAACGYEEGLNGETKKAETMPKRPKFSPWMGRDIEYPEEPVPYSLELGKKIIESYISHLHKLVRIL